MQLLDLEGLRSDTGVIRTHTRVSFTFYPHKDSVYKRETSARIVSSDPSETEANFRGLRWNKVMGQAAGQWSAQFKDRTLGFASGAVLPGDWCYIEVARNGVTFPLCVGIVESIRRQKVVDQNGKQTTIWALSGFDHGVAFDTQLAYQSLWIRSMEQLTSGLMTSKVQGAVGGSPDLMFQILIDAVFTKGTESSIWELPPALADEYNLKAGAGLLDILQKQLPEGGLRGWYGNQPRLWLNPGDTLYTALQFWCHSLLNEIILDVTQTGQHGRAPAATIRERPFPNTTDGLDSDWFGLPTWTIPVWCTNEDSLGWSNGERFNLVELLAEFAAVGSGKADQGAACPAMWNKQSIAIHGLRPLQQTTHYWDAGSLESWYVARVQWQQLLVDWNCLNPYCLSGALVTPFAMPEVRIGNRLIVKGEGEGTERQFYVEGLELNISPSLTSSTGVSGKTRFQLSRGWGGDDASLLTALNTASAGYESVGPGRTTSKPKKAFKSFKFSDIDW
ncbi:MAG TPA: hypothetical protein VM223_24640 [Planctomycetota bacterium]|nr:hypothetical protein [Planctomycetota bacterium]